MQPCLRREKGLPFVPNPCQPSHRKAIGHKSGLSVPDIFLSVRWLVISLVLNKNRSEK